MLQSIEKYADQNKNLFINEIDKFCLYHPIKNISQQWSFRKQIDNN